MYEEKNCLHKIIDRLLENAGYSKDIASAEDFEDVYEDMQRKVNELAELEQENKELSFAIEKCLENAGIECDDEENALRSLPMLGNAHYKVLVEKEELEQENKELKEQLEIDKNQINYFIEENERLKEEIASFMNGDYCTDGCKKMNNAFCDAHTAIINKNNKLRSALEKIKDLCIHYENTNDKCITNCYAHFIVTDLIQDKINECLGE